MALTKIIEVIGESNKSWEDAAKNAITDALPTVLGITGLHIKNLTATVNEKGEIVEYKANVNLAYVDK
jgi:flavin-binding protein dodecin